MVRPADVSWPVNDIRVQCHLGADECWRIRISGFVNGQFYAEETTALRHELTTGIVRLVRVFEILHRDKESL